jgi:hypothetical protein
MKVKCLSSETVKSATLTLESIDNVHGSHSLTASMLGIGDGISDNVFKEHLEDTTGLLVNEATDALDTTSACKTADCGLSDTLDIVSQDLAVTLCASLSQTLSSFSSARHDDKLSNLK